MKCAVTGVSGFIGSHLAEALVERGDRVIGIDCFTGFYSRAIKEMNIAKLMKSRNFEFKEVDLTKAEIPPLLRGVDCIFHLAAQPGVRPSWGESFKSYVDSNVVALQRVLESASHCNVPKVVYASSSSIYGDAERYPTSEETVPRPVSPYGVTKLLGENLCYAYYKKNGLSTSALRYFTVYGPRQRPDMAFHKFISSISKGEPLVVWGDGFQARDFTYVADTVRATILAAKAGPGTTYNVGSGKTIELRRAISIIERLTRTNAKVRFKPAAAGDVVKTSADITKIELDLGYSPKVSIEQGLALQVAWQSKREL